MPKVIESEWHFKQETMIVRWSSGRVLSVTSADAVDCVSRPRRPRSPVEQRRNLSTQHLAALAESRKDRLLAA